MMLPASPCFKFVAHVQVHFGVDKNGDHFKLEVAANPQQITAC